MKNIGFIGLGAMGTPMARTLLEAGFQLSAYDVVEERVEVLAESGASTAGSPRAAGEDVEALVLMVVNADQVEDALFGEEGAAQALGEGAILIIMGTVGPEAVRGIVGRMEDRGVRVLDAPVSGGVARAVEGNLLIMAGGSHDLFDEAKEILEAMGSNVVLCGESPGDGQSVKLVNQLLCGVHIAAAGEALAYAAALGLDPRAVFETIRHGAANSFMLEDRGERMLSGEFSQVKSALNIFVKDLGLVLEAAGDNGFQSPISSAAWEVFKEGSSLGFGGEDDSGIVRVFGR
ncbi:MAG: NAD(P)-dependent oxidoreductase [Rubrobacteraceae bacterium]